jgi:Mrp family chromosome partitioning ATPase
MDKITNENVKHVIAVVSGKGGVGKSMVTGLSACVSNKAGYNTGILDADMTGPSIPMMFGLNGRCLGNQRGIIPAKTKQGTRVISVNLLMDDKTDPVIWRGPIIGKMVRQFWNEVDWKNIDFLFVDMPPGTGDVAITTFGEIPIDGIIIVTSPQDLVSMIVTKAVKMAKSSDIPILGIVENMSYMECPDCGKKLYPFGESKLDEVAASFDIPVIARMPFNPEAAAAADAGTIEKLDVDYLDGLLPILKEMASE